MRRLVLALVVTSALFACEGRRQLREWQPSDHQAPPAVAPEGQGTGATADDPATANARAAQSLWDMRCATCHGASGRGDGPGRSPGAALPDLTAADYRGKRTDAELHAIIKNGRNMMPGFGSQLTDIGIDAMVQHVRTLSR